LKAPVDKEQKAVLEKFLEAGSHIAHSEINIRKIKVYCWLRLHICPRQGKMYPGRQNIYSR
jgi:hypothetical protein